MTDTTTEDVNAALTNIIKGVAGLADIDTLRALAAERDTLTARVAELEAALDSAEIAGGLTNDGNLWRFWSAKANTFAAANARLRAFVTGYAMRALFSEHERDEQFLLDHDTLLFQRDCDIVEARAAVAQIIEEAKKKTA